jgi:hypothetical protein
MRHPRYFSIMLFFSLALLFACFHRANAETPGQSATNPSATEIDPVSTEMTTPQNPSESASQQKLKTDQTPQPVTPKKSEERFGPQVDPCFTVHVEGDTWLDQVHGFVQDNTCEPSVWFDTFFVKDHILLDPRPARSSY